MTRAKTSTGSRTIVSVTLALLAAGCQRSGEASAPPQPAPTSPPPPHIASAPPTAPQTVYYCDDGRELRATYNGDDATVEVGGRRHALKIALSGSGARYAGDGLQWWTKGLDRGRLSILKPGEIIAADPGVNCSTIDAPVSPPDPGRPGGLPGDRTPVAEGAVATDAQKAADVVQRYFALLESGRAAEAAPLRTDGKAPDLAPYRSYHAQVGAPGRIEGAAGSLFVEAPVVIYGRMKTGPELHQSGKAVLRRVNGVPGATPEQLTWRIERLEVG